MIAITGTHMYHAHQTALVAEGRVLTPETKLTIAASSSLRLQRGSQALKCSATPYSQCVAERPVTFSSLNELLMWRETKAFAVSVLFSERLAKSCWGFLFLVFPGVLVSGFFNARLS